MWLSKNDLTGVCGENEQVQGYSSRKDCSAPAGMSYLTATNTYGEHAYSFPKSSARCKRRKRLPTDAVLNR